MICVRDLRRFLGTLALVVAIPCGPAVAQRVWVVEPAGNGHFIDIQSAVDAAGDGDLILVRPHPGTSWYLYEPFTIRGKSLSVIGVEVWAHAFEIRPSVEVRDLRATQTVLLANLRVAATGYGPEPGALLVNCLGGLRLSRCDLALDSNSTGEALWVERCPDVALVDCEVRGGYAPAQAGLWSTSSQVALYRCETEAGFGGRPGYRSGDSFLLAQGGEIQGGEGDWVDCYEEPGAGGPGAHLFGTASLYTLDALLVGGDGGWADDYWCTEPQQGPDGPRLVLEDSATHTVWPTGARSIEAPDLVFGGPTSVVIRGLPGDRAFLSQATAPGFTLRADLHGIALLSALSVPRIELGTIPASGILQTEIELDGPTHDAEAVRRFFQLSVEDAVGQEQLGEPWTVVVARKTWDGPCGLPLVVDCNANGVPDLCDIDSGQSGDVNENLVPDECEPASLRLFVDRDATGANDGSSWADAFVSLYDAIPFAKQANGVRTEIWVSEGTYVPGTSQYSYFELIERIDWYGGFSGVEQHLDERDPNLHVTVLSGDRNGDDGPDFANYIDNCLTIVKSSYDGVFEPTILDGFVITGALGQPAWNGGGISAALCPGLLVRNCRIVANRALSGGGGYFHLARVEDCVFGGNRANYEGGGVRAKDAAKFTRCTFVDNESVSREGGGLYIEGNACPVEDCTFVGNRAPWSRSTLGGGGLHSRSSNQQIVRSVFVDNSSGGRGGAISAYSAALQIESCTFLGNESGEGGAIWARRSATVANSLFSGNRAELGGAIFAVDFDDAELRIQLCTFSENGAQQLGGGIFLAPDQSFSATNSIFWGNRDSTGAGALAQIHGLMPGSATHCCIQQELGGALGYPVRNLHIDPRFFDPTGPDGMAGTRDDDLRLGAGSPCIDAGSNALVPPGLTLDIEGLPRFVDDPNVPDTGEGLAPIVDMGCHEHP